MKKTCCYAFYTVLLTLFLSNVSFAKLLTNEATNQELILTVQQRINELSGLKDSTSASLMLERYQSALDRLNTVQSLIAQAELYQKAMDTKDQQEIKLTHQIKSLESSPYKHEKVPVNGTEILNDINSTLINYNENLTHINNEITQLQSRNSLIQGEFITAQSALENAQSDLEKFPSAKKTDSNPSYIISLADLRVQSATIKKLELELRSHDTRLSLARLHKQLTILQLEYNQERYDYLTSEFTQKKQTKAEIIAENSASQQEKFATADPIIQKIAKENGDLALELTTVYENIQNLSKLKQKTEKNFQTVISSSQEIQEQVATLGSDNFLGELLLNQRSIIADIEKQSYEETVDHGELNNARHRQIRLQQALKKSPHKTEKLQLKIGDNTKDKALIATLMIQQETILQELLKGWKEYANELTNLNFTRAKLQSKSTEALEGIDEELLWLATSKPLSLEWFKDLFKSVKKTADLFTQDQFDSQLKKLKNRFFFALLAASLLFVFALYSHKKINRRLEHHAQKIKRISTDSIYLTVESLALTIVVSIKIPILLLLASAVLGVNSHTTSIETAISAGLFSTALAWFALDFSTRVFQNQGLAILHFRVNKEFCHKIFNLISPTRIWFTSLLGIGAFFQKLANQQLDDTLGRLLFFLFTLSFAALLIQIRRIYFQTQDQENSGYWKIKLFKIGFPVIYISLIFLAIASAVGYQYTAITISRNIILSLCSILIVLLIYSILYRWLVVARKKIRWQQLINRRVQAIKEAEQKSSDVQPDIIPEIESHEININVIQSQALTLVKLTCTGILFVLAYIVWDDARPALSALDSINLWQESHVVDGKVIVNALSMLDLSVTVIFIILTIVGSRNIPGLLEILVIQHFEMDAGTRYAALTLARYLILGIGIIASFNAMGISWAKIQWLIAAISVGLGFGLQEIVANFVGGIVVLFERPMRVGDTVTINNYNGTVTSIRMRTTTIIDWDNKEVIVPNKLFISDSLINWTLSSDITRIIFQVGVAYGSDTALTEKVILEALENNKEVLDDPNPSVFFIEFGDNSLIFEVRAYLSGANRRLPLTHQLHMDIDRRMREANIEIAFPQIDVHLKGAAKEG